VKVARMRKKRMNQEQLRERSQIPQLTRSVYLEKLLPGTRFWTEVWEKESGLTPRSCRTLEKGQRGILWVPYWQVSRRTGTL